MAHAIHFDTLQYAKKLKEAGMPENQAEIQAEALQQVLIEQSTELATKSDLRDVKNEINLLRHEMKEIELRMTIKLGSIMIAGLGVLGYILGYLIKSH